MITGRIDIRGWRKRLRLCRNDAGGDDVEGHVLLTAEALQIVGRGFVADVRHAHMDGLDPEVRMMDARAAGQQFQEAKRVLAARESEEHVVVVLEQTVGGKRADEPLVDATE